MTDFKSIYKTQVLGQSRGDAAGLNIGRLLDTLSEDQVAELLQEDNVKGFWDDKGVDPVPNDADEIKGAIADLDEDQQKEFLAFFEDWDAREAAKLHMADQEGGEWPCALVASWDSAVPLTRRQVSHEKRILSPSSKRASLIRLFWL